jgi:NADH dehydrogenase [ubiquinone] 1 alpha subcomplex assembly factor 7
MVETSPGLRRRQREALAGHRVQWHDRIETVPRQPMLVIANEFFDALPVHQLIRTKLGWRERLVAGGEDGLHFVLSQTQPPAASLLALGVQRRAPLGAVAEIQPALLLHAAAISARLAQDGGAALILDYGHALSATGNTLQAVRQHRPHDVLADPGVADLTVHVDFDALARAAGGGVQCFGPCGQGDFLRALGIEVRAAHLSAAATPGQAGDIASGVARLIAPDQMGTLFKVLVLAHLDMEPPPGFEHA